MASSRKKVLLRTTDDVVHAGYLAPSAFVSDGQIELLDLTGRIVTIALKATRMICFVQDFNLGSQQPEELTRRAYLARPRSQGLWLRMILENGESLEGLAALDISILDGVLEDGGLFVFPPDVRCNTQRVFLPRSSIRELEIVAVITTPSKAQAKTEPARNDKQPRLFAD